MTDVDVLPTCPMCFPRGDGTTLILSTAFDERLHNKSNKAKHSHMHVQSPIVNRK